jgi:hypothetical protein
VEPQDQRAAAGTTGLSGRIRVLTGEARAGLAATVNSALPIDDPLKHDFYPAMCRDEGWSTSSCKAVGTKLYKKEFKK